MPIHDWTRVGDGTFHYFHQRWMGEIADVLNDGLLPPRYYAMTEQFAAGFSSRSKKQLYHSLAAIV